MKLATTAAKEIADAAMQVMGGYGYVAEYHVERLWRDAKLLNRRWHAGISPEEHRATSRRCTTRFSAERKHASKSGDPERGEKLLRIR